MGKTKQKKSIIRVLKCRTNKKTIMQKNVINTKKLVAVYGTLLSGCSNHKNFLRDANFEGEFWTEPSYKLFSNSNETYPYLMKGGNTSVKMEVYGFHGKYIEDALDSLEGVSHGLYDKGSINTPQGKAILYVRNEKMWESDPLIVSGDWKEFKKTGL